MLTVLFISVDLINFIFVFPFLPHFFQFKNFLSATLFKDWNCWNHCPSVEMVVSSEDLPSSVVGGLLWIESLSWCYLCNMRGSENLKFYRLTWFWVKYWLTLRRYGNLVPALPERTQGRSGWSQVCMWCWVCENIYLLVWWFCKVRIRTANDS